MYIDADDGTAIRCDACDELFTCHGGSIGDLNIASNNIGWITFVNTATTSVAACPCPVVRTEPQCDSSYL